MTVHIFFPIRIIWNSSTGLPHSLLSPAPLAFLRKVNREHWNSVLLLCCTEDWVPHCLHLETSHIMWPKQQNQNSGTAAIVLLTPSVFWHDPLLAWHSSQRASQMQEETGPHIHQLICYYDPGEGPYLCWSTDFMGQGLSRQAQTGKQALVRRCSKRAVSLVSEGSNRIRKSKQWSSCSPWAMLTWYTWVCHTAAAPCVILDFSAVIFSLEEEDGFLLLLWFQKFAAKVVAEHWAGKDWWGSEVGQSLKVPLKKILRSHLILLILTYLSPLKTIALKKVSMSTKQQVSLCVIVH